MTIAKNRLMTLDDYLTYDDGSEGRYELENGTLVEMAPENPLNSIIVSVLKIQLANVGVSPYCLSSNSHAIQVVSEHASTRIPDLVVHSEASIQAILGDNRLLRLSAPPPTLVVETVSSSTTDKASRDRDYISKRAEYAHREIPEYWIIDPEEDCVLILTLIATDYKERKYVDNQQIVSPSFPSLSLTARQILSAGMDST